MLVRIGIVADGFRHGVVGLDQQIAVAVEAVLVALQEVRTDVVGGVMIKALARPSVSTWLIGSPLLAEHASTLTGSCRNDAEAAQWTVRVFLSLLVAPGGDAASERALVQRFLKPAFEN